MTISSRVTISNEKVEIPVPCKIKLDTNGSLQLNHVELRSKHLVISDLQPNGETRVNINNSTLTGVGGSGFLLQLSDFKDSVAIHHSTIDYPVAVWARIYGLAENASGGGRIKVTNSTIRSLDPKSDGIQLVASEKGGVGEFEKLRLETVKLDSRVDPNLQKALLFAGKCKAEKIEGAPNRCGPRAEGREYDARDD